MISPASTAFNSVDYFILFTFGLSILAGYLRGFLRELISLISWIAASIVATLFSGKLATFFSGFGSQAAKSVASSFGSSGAGAQQSISAMSIGISFIILFLGTLFVGFLVGTVVTGLTVATGQSLSNRFFGALFGGVRGFIIVVILMFIAELTPLGVQPAWVQSQFVRSFHPFVVWIDKMVHPSLTKIKVQVESMMEKVNVPSTLYEGVEQLKGQGAKFLSPGQ